MQSGSGAVVAPSPPNMASSPSMPSPGLNNGTVSPSISATNRFGLGLSYFRGRPRAGTGSRGSSAMFGSHSNASQVNQGQPPSPDLYPPSSPAREFPPSPGAGSANDPVSTGEGGGMSPSGRAHGFPVLRRRHSRRSTTGQAGINLAQPSVSSTNLLSGSATANDSQVSTSSRQRRSSSQPPVPPPGLLRSHNPFNLRLPGLSHPNDQNAASTLTSADPNSIAGNRSAPSTPAAERGESGTTAEHGDTAPSTDAATAQSSGNATVREQHLRLVPYLESARSLRFDPVTKVVTPSVSLKIGRCTDRRGDGSNLNDAPDRIVFKSKVVSRGHAEIFCDENGGLFIRDTKSSSGTFLNHLRLSGPNVQSRPFSIKDGDVLQLGVDYQGGTEEIYRCVKMRVELNRQWQQGANQFNTSALSQLQALGVEIGGPKGASGKAGANRKAGKTKKSAATADCCICLYPISVCQALFIAPCQHCWHFKCIRPLLMMHHPGFTCPLCRTFADLEADVEIEAEEVEGDEDDVEEVEDGDDDDDRDSVKEEAPQTPTAGPRVPTEFVEAPAEVQRQSVAPGPSGTPSDFDPYERRSSIMISGPNGVPVPLAITGRSRPSSIVNVPIESRRGSSTHIPTLSTFTLNSSGGGESGGMTPSRTMIGSSWAYPLTAGGSSALTNDDLIDPLSSRETNGSGMTDDRASYFDAPSFQQADDTAIHAFGDASTPPNSTFISTEAEAPVFRSHPNSVVPNGPRHITSLSAAMNEVIRPSDGEAGASGSRRPLQGQPVQRIGGVDLGATGPRATSSGSGSGSTDAADEDDADVSTDGDSSSNPPQHASSSHFTTAAEAVDSIKGTASRFRDKLMRTVSRS